MSVAARLKLGAALLLGLSFGTSALAEEAGQPGRTWTDPPARVAAPAPAARHSGEAAAPQATPAARQVARSEARATTRASAGRPARHASRSARPASRIRVAARPQQTLAVREVYPTRLQADRRVAMRSGYMPVQREPEVADYGYPVGQVEAPLGFRAVDDRRDAIRAAQAAGYVVMHARTVQFPDGRSLRTYRPMDADRDED